MAGYSCTGGGQRAAPGGGTAPWGSPERQGTIHVVQPGEHLTAIANRYGTIPQAIASANNLVNMNLLYVGQRLTIPGSAILNLFSLGTQVDSPKQSALLNS